MPVRLAKKAANQAANQAANVASSIQTWAVNHVEQKHDQLIGRAINRSLAYGQGAVLDMVEDPYMPWRMRRHVHIMYYWLWSRFAEDMEADLKREFFRSTDFKQAKAFRDQRFDYWPTSPVLLAGFQQPGFTYMDGVAHLLRALRARFLYAENPADGSAWKVVRDPLGALVLLLKLNIATSVVCFLVLFLLSTRPKSTRTRRPSLIRVRLHALSSLTPSTCACVCVPPRAAQWTTGTSSSSCVSSSSSRRSWSSRLV